MNFQKQKYEKIIDNIKEEMDHLKEKNQIYQIKIKNHRRNK